MVTVGITGATLWGNRGAEAMLVTTIGQVRKRYPDAKIVVFSYFAEADRRLLQDRQVTIISATPGALTLGHFPLSVLSWLLGLLGLRLPALVLPPSVRWLRRCDVLLDVSGIAFADGRAKFLPFNILLMWPALLLGTPVVRLSQALGPFKTLPIRLAAKLFLPRCHMVYARGDVTADYLRVLPLPQDRFATVPDIAFCYEPGYSLTTESEARLAETTEQLAALHSAGKQVIGLIPSSVVYNKAIKSGMDYEAQFLDLIQRLNPEAHFVFLPNATRQGSPSSRNNDLYVIDKIRARAQAELSQSAQSRLLWVDYDVNTDGTRRIISRCDALVTSRFHGMISGLSLAVPTAVIGWSHKYREIMDRFGMADYALDFSDMQAATEMVSRLLSEGERIRDELAQALPSVKSDSESQFDILATILSANRR